MKKIIKTFGSNPPNGLEPSGRFILKLIILFQLIILSVILQAQNYPKREMRAVWVATVRNIDWPSKQGLSVADQQKELTDLIDLHKENGMNVIVFQVRPACDAMYQSTYEPWAQWLTGIQGQTPEPFYDPLEFIIEECHKRNIELHAWFNPYRAVSDYETFLLDSSHIAIQHPEMIITYGKNKYLNPGLPETRDYVTKIVADVVSRYDIDAVHMDDYFYPYKIAGLKLPDEDTFRKYSRGFTEREREDWRRDNVDLIIKRLQDTIKSIKPWVKFGISPFGVWRNSNVDPKGSDTKAGQTNYDDLYADILKWLKKGWIDYVTPQAYWHIGFEIADHKIIAEWWNGNSFNRNLYIGHGIHRLDKKSKYKEWQNINEIVRQIRLSRSLSNVSGNFYFSSKVFQRDPLKLNKTLRKKIYPYPALIPENPAIESVTPDPPSELRIINLKKETRLNWDASKDVDTGSYYVVYRFKGKNPGDFENPENIFQVTGNREISLRKRFFLSRKTYTVKITKVSRSHSESKTSVKVILKY